MNFIERWIASVFVKRVALSLAAGGAAYLAAHSLPGVSELSGFGIDIVVKIDPEKFADAASVAFGAFAQGGHEWIAAKYPEIGKYI